MINSYMDEVKDQGMDEGQWNKVKQDGYDATKPQAMSSHTKGIKDEKSMMNALTNSNPAWPNVKKGN